MRKKIFFVVIVITLAACAQSSSVPMVTAQSNQSTATKLPISTPTPVPSLTPPPSPPQPTPTPAPLERITFATIQGEPGDAVISFVNSDGSGLESPSLFEPFYDTNLSTGNYLAWSPNGRFLAFDGADKFIPCDLPECNNSINYGTFVADYSNNTVIRHVEDTYANASWSPDSQHLVLSIRGEAITHGFKRELHILDVENGEIKLLTHAPTNDLYPAWSPDGMWIAFVRFDPNPEFGCDPFPEITLFSGEHCHLGSLYRIRPDGSDLQLLFKPVFINNPVSGGGIIRPDAPVWSPDSKWLAFPTRNENEDEHPDIAIINVETGERELVSGAKGPDMNPTWSPNGEKLAFYSQRDGNYGIYLWDLKEKTYTYLVGGYLPVWSWSGAHIAFFYGDQLGMMDVDGTNIVLIDHGRIRGKPAWHPNAQP